MQLLVLCVGVGVGVDVCQCMVMTLSYYPIGMDLESDGDADKEAIVLMKRNLPTYVCNSFVAAGFDTLSVIAEMDVSNSPGNSLQVIEDFITKEYPNDPRFYRSNMTCTFFLPGHRQRIVRFVKQVKEQLEEEKKQMKRKRRGASNSVHMSKRGKSDGDTSNSSSDSHTSLFSMIGDIRKQVSKWQRQQKDEKLRKLREHQHFEIKVSEGEGESTNASVSCLVCGRSSALGQKHGKVLISNWTRHAIKCVQSQQFSGTTAHMHRLDKHFSKSRMSPSSSERASVSSPSPELFSPAFEEQKTMHNKSVSEIVHMPEATGSEDTLGGMSEDTYEVGSVTEDACGGVSEHAHGRMTEGTQGITMDYTSQGAHEGTRTQEVLSESRVTHGKVPGDTQTGVSESTDEIICTKEISSDTAWQGTCEGPRVSDTEEIRAGRLTEDSS